MVLVSSRAEDVCIVRCVVWSGKHGAVVEKVLRRTQAMSLLHSVISSHNQQVCSVFDSKIRQLVSFVATSMCQQRKQLQATRCTLGCFCEPSFRDLTTLISRLFSQSLMKQENRTYEEGWMIQSKQPMPLSEDPKQRILRFISLFSSVP